MPMKERKRSDCHQSAEPKKDNAKHYTSALNFMDDANYNRATIRRLPSGTLFFDGRDGLRHLLDGRLMCVW